MGFNKAPAVVAAALGLLIWLIGASIMISRGLTKTGLGARIGYAFIAAFGKRTLGIGYALALSELVIAPVTPSNTARGGAIIHPIMRAIALSFGSDPEQGTQNRIGRYLALVNYQANPITSVMFITATAPNPLVVKLVADATGAQIQLSWGTWALAMLLPGLVAIALMPWIIYLLYPPEIKRTPDAAAFAREKLTALGPVQPGEWIMLGTFALLLVLWAGVPAMLLRPGVERRSDHHRLHRPGGAAAQRRARLGGRAQGKERMGHRGLVLGAGDDGQLPEQARPDPPGCRSRSSPASARWGSSWAAPRRCSCWPYLYAHYFFASTTAHITAMFAAFYTAGLALGAPPMPFALIMAAASSIMMTLTHYATGTSPVIFGSGYTTLGEGWKVGFVMSVLLLVWVVVGGAWWRVLGHW